MRVLAKDIKDYAGKEVTVQGWIHRIRDLGGVNFIVFRDRSGRIQLVTNDELDVTLESVVSVTGTVQANEKAPGGYEIQMSNMDVLAPAAADLPFPVNQDPEKIGLETILDNRAISLRNPKILSIFRLQADIMRYFGEYLRAQDFTEIKSTKLVGGATEGGTNLFRVEYFDTSVCLAQSPQVYKQTMVSSGLERVFEISHAYRAEKHETSRHINEYVSMDVEMGFIEDEMELIELERGAMKYIFTKIKENNQRELDDWGATVPDPELCDKIPVISHEQCKKIVSERVGKRFFEINPEAEVVISEWAMEEYGIDLVFINEFPRKKRPFYTYPKGLKTMSFDLVFRGLEITTGGRRINEYRMFQEALPKFGLTEEELGAYASIFKYGCPPHGGFAIGLERLTQKILGLNNVKEASLFPRDRKRITP
ncbi:MAG: aspartate--tRNA(Asn) ligase [Spirochaetales bacterium]|nr:aspartate--tRNA(Asn) ligase [Spirochaetales bacterium]